mmetsp:Transcript_11391/g.27313  ORF Transcript_11391/g.27313 Transcript_11391/m.27313 type:complete len:202 (-) Transcript_11391:21-626(-)
MRSPERKSSEASARRNLGRQTTDITAGHTPSRTSVNPISASSERTEISVAAAKPTPPPVQCPAMRPITGLGETMMSSSTSVRVCRGGSCCAPPFKSAPAQNVLPAFVRTITRTASSLCAAASRSPSASTSSKLRAFLFCGRLSVSVATPLATSYSTASEALALAGSGRTRLRPSGTSTKPRVALKNAGACLQMVQRAAMAE